jgi:hypothetical protein
VLPAVAVELLPLASSWVDKTFDPAHIDTPPRESD